MIHSMMAASSVLPLQQYIASLNSTCLPRILQVCSGVYFQGSIYEISGNEVCFSTGDVIKVTGIELLSVCCKDVSSDEKFELPINHTGLFKISPEVTPYSTVEELVKLRPVDLESCLPVTFTSRNKMTLEDVTLREGAVLTLLSVEDDRCRCHIRGNGEASAEVYVSLATRGEFYMCGGEERFTLREIMASPCLRLQRFHFVNTAMWQQTLVLSPVYQICAVMNLRKNVLRFPSSLEVDVVDITDMCKEVNFVSPLSLADVHSLTDEFFPVVVEVLEGPETGALFNCRWLPHLQKGTLLVFHGKRTSAMTVMSSLKSRKSQYFLVSKQYGGQFRRRPRGFDSVYELYVASMQAPGLKVSVTRNCEEVEEEGLPGLSVGEQLEVVGCQKVLLPCGGTERQSVDALVCQRLQDVDEGDEDEDVFLPLYMQGHFVEVLSDNKKYKLEDLGRMFKLPLNVKAVSRDPELEVDPLVGFPCLRVEGATLEPTILASFLHSPELCFEIPAQRISMSVCQSQHGLPWPVEQPPECHVECVTEVTDRFLHQFLKDAMTRDEPPPRPPKRNQFESTTRLAKASQSTPSQEFSSLTLRSRSESCSVPPPPARQATLTDRLLPITPLKHSAPPTLPARAAPKTYVRVGTHVKGSPWTSAAEHSDDYEEVEDMLAVMVKETQESAAFY
ncbi:protein THEMIS2 isoform X2 [Dunckerocampus dactyliophorus]|uniref:protein THEMIS2 isoform X2 n=1 Tax=Dunckerocampus dactyliophorus TaxID=161453 RepID=UPI002404AC76|nr:protein THEMIS2 isoform X2 [Dunckerocampus dactyliophorus]